MDQKYHKIDPKGLEYMKKYWDSLKGFFLLYAQKLSGGAKTFVTQVFLPLSRSWDPSGPQ